MIQTPVGSGLSFDTLWLLLISKKEMFTQVQHSN